MAETITTQLANLELSRPGTPDSQLTNSLYRAHATIDDLTTTLSKVSRAPTPDNSNLLHCCCGRKECNNTKAWAAFQSKLESRLILCAEVGQALLEKHEAYVRRHGSDDLEPDDDSRLSVPSRPDTPTATTPSTEFHSEARIAQLLKENLALEKRLNSAFLNSEVSESSKKTLLQELEDAKETVARLTLSQAKSTGWEARLNAAVQERDDFRQELDSERQRAKAAEAHVVALKERLAKQQSETSRLYDDLERQRLSRTELSDEILRDARARLQMLQQSQLGHTVVTESPEVTQFMESLVADNEAMKRDVAELQNMLVESREDVRALREEVEETRAAQPGESSKLASRATRAGHGHTYSWASSFGHAPLSPSWNHDGVRSRPRSTAPSGQTYEPLTPNTELRPLSPAVSRTPSERRLPTLSSPLPKYPPSHLNIDIDDKSLRAKTPDTPEKRSPRRALLLLTHSRGVQTDSVNWAHLLGPAFNHAQVLDDSSSSTPPNDGRSESSSLADGSSHSSTVAALVDRTNNLFTRLAQADARTLTNRLKRQRLAGDVPHLSRATVSAILSEVNGLRAHFRAVLEDEKVVSTCTRRDFRALLSLFREMFTELGQMRITLNDVILDPSLAPKVSEAAMDPSGGADEGRGRATTRHGPALGGWMAPLSKLFGTATGASSESKPLNDPPGLSRAVSGPLATAATSRQKAPRFVPKLGPALAASTTTVNVEFSGTGVGRSVSNALTVSNANAGVAVRPTTPTPVPPAGSSRAVMGIFAGAPRPQEADPWIVVSPKPERRLRGAPSAANLTGTLSRTAGRRNINARLPRNVDAVIDSESPTHDPNHEGSVGFNVHESLLERTLRPRGLSDSSIHSTFLKDDDAPPREASGVEASSALPPHLTHLNGPLARQGAFPGHNTTRASVLHALSRSVQALKSPAFSGPASDVSASPPNTSNMGEHGPARAVSPRRINILPSFASWAAAQAGLDAEATEDFVGSVREEEANSGHRGWQRDLHGRDI